MAFKNLELDDMSRFGDRLMCLMKEKTKSGETVCDTAPKLAQQLYQKKLITPNQYHVGDDDLIEDDEDYLTKKAIATITKQIQKHINSADCQTVTGEYISAYCQFFSCSADFLFGYTKIKTKNPSIRKICETTGLSEEAVNVLVGNTEYPAPVMDISRLCWSQLIGSDLFTVIPHDFLSAKTEAFEYLRHKAAIDAIHKTLEGKDESSVGFNLVAIKEKVIQKGLDAHYAAYYGMLYKLAQSITTELDKLVEMQSVSEEVYKKHFDGLVWQYSAEYAAANDEKIPPRPDGEFKFNDHFII